MLALLIPLLRGVRGVFLQVVVIQGFR